jgi:chromate transporter
VGVIQNLALVFGLAVLFPQGVGGGVNWFALVLSAASFVALYKLKIDALWVVLASGVIGCVWKIAQS